LSVVYQRGRNGSGKAKSRPDEVGDGMRTRISQKGQDTAVYAAAAATDSRSEKGSGGNTHYQKPHREEGENEERASVYFVLPFSFLLS